jgi:hypothetical protein
MHQFKAAPTTHFLERALADNMKTANSPYATAQYAAPFYALRR